MLICSPSLHSYAELGRQAIGSTHTDLTADKHGGPLKENRNSQDEERDDALGLRLDLNLVSVGLTYSCH